MEDDGSGGGGGGRSRRYEFGGETNAQSTGLTLGGILSIKQTPPYRIQDRTLLDLIRDDQTCGKESKKTWKMFREKLRLKLAGSVCTTNLPTLASHVLITAGDGNRVTTRHGSTQRSSTDGDESRRLNSNSPPVRNSSSVTETRTDSVRVETPVEEIERISTEENRGGGGGEPAAAAARMSLMSLLEVDGSGYLDDDEEEEVEEEAVVVVAEGGGGGYKYNNCCVCMVRHKGAAFIPCGHTFCRLCSRELFVQRASCPLCNNFILEILDIF